LTVYDGFGSMHPEVKAPAAQITTLSVKMKIDDKTAIDIGIALIEATLLGAEYDAARNIVVTTFAVSRQHFATPAGMT
jgi:hypothetical protein